MRRLPAALLALAVAYIVGHVVAYALDMTPDAFFGLVAWLLGGALAIFGSLVVLAQLGRR